MSAEYTIKFSLRLDAPVFRAIEQEADHKGREVVEHIQRILGDYASKNNLMKEEEIKEYELRWGLVDRACDLAVEREHKIGFEETIIGDAIKDCEADEKWLASYEKYVQDNPYKHGNPRKGLINRELGRQIKIKMKAVAIKGPDGKPKKKPVTGSIVQSYTLLRKV